VELRLSPQGAGLPQLACALDKRLLAALRGVFDGNGVALKSIQPRLMAAYNNSRLTLSKQSAWFVLYEPGCLCLALLQHGSWASVRTMRVGSDWRNALALLIDREAYLAAPNADTKMVLWAPNLQWKTCRKAGVGKFTTCNRFCTLRWYPSTRGAMQWHWAGAHDV
jgi:hypothetical protein